MVKLAVKLASKLAQQSSDVMLQSVEVVANSVGHPTQSQSLTYGDLTQLESSIIFVLRDNQPPQVNSFSPTELDTVMQTIPFVSTINATDDYDLPSQMNYQWLITDNTGSLVYSASSMNYSNSITISLPGSYFLRVVVTDSFPALPPRVI